MDLLIPLKLNHNRKSSQQEGESTSIESNSPTKTVLGREQAKKRLLAFAQQWNKTKENLMADKSLQKKQNEHGTLKFTYVVEGEDGREISFPSHLIKYTRTEPAISYCENPHYAQGAYQNRKEVFEAADEDTKRVMYFIMNSSSPSCQNQEFAGRYRKWYVDHKFFIGKTQDPSEELPSRYSPHWETDSEEETNHRSATRDFDVEIQAVPALPEKKVVSKVKINNFELPFFEDEEFLESLVVKEAPAKDINEEYSAFISSLETNDDEKPKEEEATVKEEEEAIVKEEEAKRQSPDWDEEWRKARYRRYHDRKKRSPRSPKTPEEDEMKPEEFNEESNLADAKRISLDERLELELGIKLENGPHISLASPTTAEHLPVDPIPSGRKRGFGPKAAPLGAVIFSCPKAFPAAPAIPPHLQGLLHRPLVRTIAPVQENVEAMEVEEKKDEKIEEVDAKKDWDRELRNLEVAACNLETADETVLEELEQKLLQFENNILPSGGESPSHQEEDNTDVKKKSTKRPKRPKPPPIELKEAGKGILIMPRFSLLDDGEGNQKKAVVFADHVKPGCGTSSEDEEEPHIRSPPVAPPPEETTPKKKLKRKIVGEDFDPIYDLLPPPPPPPGSPPPHLPQGRSLTPVSSPVAASPVAVEC